jgi:hypothetical protein
VQLLTGVLVMVGFGTDAAATMAGELGVKLETLVGLIASIIAGVGLTMNKIRSGTMHGGLAGLLIKAPPDDRV